MEKIVKSGLESFDFQTISFLLRFSRLKTV